MTPLDEALASTNPNVITTAIRERQEMRGQLVGNLYPSILVGEEAKLEARLAELHRKGLKAKEA